MDSLQADPDPAVLLNIALSFGAREALCARRWMKEFFAKHVHSRHFRAIDWHMPSCILGGGRTQKASSNLLEASDQRDECSCRFEQKRDFASSALDGRRRIRSCPGAEGQLPREGPALGMTTIRVLWRLARGIVTGDAERWRTKRGGPGTVRPRCAVLVPRAQGSPALPWGRLSSLSSSALSVVPGNRTRL